MSFFKKLFVPVFLCTALLASPFADTGGFAEGDDFDDDVMWVNYIPSVSYWGVRGLSQNMSAEPLGARRFNAAFSLSYFKQEQEIIAPAVGANVITMRGVLAYGLNDKVDLFGLIPMYSISGDEYPARTTISGITGGVKFLIPVIPEEIPFVRLAGSIYLNQGLRVDVGGEWNDKDATTNFDYWKGTKPSDNEKNDWDGRNGEKHNLSYAGFDYFDARKNNQLDLVLNITGSFFMGKYIQLHTNYAPVIVTPGITDEIMCLLSAGLQIDATDFLTIGLEGNWRTLYSSTSLSDPLWVTPSLMLRSPYYGNGKSGMGLLLGANFRVSQVDDNKTHSLEKYRFFFDVVSASDFFASKRIEIERERRRNEAEKARLRKEAALTSAQKDSIARKAHEDSLRLAAEMAQRALSDSIRAKQVADSLAAAGAQSLAEAEAKRIADSIALATAGAQSLAEAEAKRIADSIAHAQAHAQQMADAMAEAQRKLDEERAKRSDMENMLLNTGMIVLDAVQFAAGRTEIHANSRPYLTIIARMLVKYPKLKIEIGGHTDATGQYQTNMNLSQQRANAVFMFMQSVEPGLAQMLIPKGYGPTVPKADNSTAAGRETNRRVELKVLNPEVLEEYK